VECDIRDKDQVEQIFQEYSLTTVVHLAAILNTASRKNPSEASQVNIVGSLNILEAARKFCVPRILYGSSISVYGTKPGMNREGVSEIEPAAPEDVYGAAKRYIEIVGETFHQQFGMQFIALRIASVVGPGAVNTSSPWRSEVFGKLRVSNNAEIALPYRNDKALPLVYVEDVATMFESLIDTEQPALTVYNTPSETWTLQELATYIQSLNKNMKITFGQLQVQGIPKVINGQQFVTEFGYPSLSIRERLRRAALEEIELHHQ